MFLLPIKLDRVSFETKGRQNLQKTADFLIESIVFCPLVPPSWISLVDPTSAMYASAIYVSYIYGIEAAREKALVKSGHVTPQILDILVTWPYYGYASTGGELIEVTEYIFKMSFKIHSTRHESG